VQQFWVIARWLENAADDPSELPEAEDEEEDEALPFWKFGQVFGMENPADAAVPLSDVKDCVSERSVTVANRNNPG
jgi:hypothetical protein